MKEAKIYVRKSDRGGWCAGTHVRQLRSARNRKSKRKAMSDARVIVQMLANLGYAGTIVEVD